MSYSRRSFLKTMAASAAAPLLLPSRVWSAPTGPNNKVGVGCIGLGMQGRGLLGGFLGQDARVLAICDVDTNRRNDSKQRVDRHYGNTDCQAYNDFRDIIKRKDIDVVCIATPDHWHTIPILAALRAGKDVYCEKPLTHNIHEAIEVIKAVDANRRVLQTGSMQRSMKEFRVACELAQNGVIGKITRVECSFGPPGRPCDLGEEPLEPGLDWEMWIGPGPMRAYNSVLSPRGIHGHYPDWRSYKEYGGGMVCDWGAHHLDIAQWGLGMDDSGPVEVLPAEAGAVKGAKLVYANGVTIEHKDNNGPDGHFGTHFFGTDGEITVNRGSFKLVIGGKEVVQGPSCAAKVQAAEREFLKDAKVKLYVSNDHVSNFMDCVRSRKKPVTSEQVGGRSAICCHLLNQSYYHNAKLQWDPRKFKFTGGTGDPSWLTREYRSPWKD